MVLAEYDFCMVLMDTVLCMMLLSACCQTILELIWHSELLTSIHMRHHFGYCRTCAVVIVLTLGDCFVRFSRSFLHRFVSGGPQREHLPEALRALLGQPRSHLATSTGTQVPHVESAEPRFLKTDS